jgi:nicotinate-nucleotide adenylyltransferase
LARVGILGGTFDPPHKGHIAIAQAALKKLGLAKVIFIPANVPPHKTKQPLAPARDRLDMLKLAIGNNPYFEISTIELDRPGPSYTVDTLAEFCTTYPDDELFLIIGADNVSEIETWHKPELILESATLAAANRPNFIPSGTYADKAVYFEMPPMEISSTEIRERVRTGKPISEFVCPGVEAFIKQHELYQI